MIGTGSFFGAQLDEQGNLEIKSQGFEITGALCWIWTELGMDLPSVQLSVTMTDGAGHISTASTMLSCQGREVHDFTTGSFTVPGILVAVGGGVGGTTSLIPASAIGLISPVIDRKQELAEAFKKGLAVKSTPPKGSAAPEKKMVIATKKTTKKKKKTR